MESSMIQLSQYRLARAKEVIGMVEAYLQQRWSETLETAEDK